jgi:hypothetical protein
VGVIAHDGSTPEVDGQNCFAKLVSADSSVGAAGPSRAELKTQVQKTADKNAQA